MSLRNFLCALAALWLVPAAGAQSVTDLVINEIDADQTSTDTGEFVELYNPTGSAIDLSGAVLVSFNGSNDTSYGAVDLDGFTIPAGGYFVYCGDATVVPNCDLEVGAGTTNLIQNGQDAVALYTGEAAGFPDGTPATSMNLVDAIVYDTDDDDDAELLAALGQTTQYNENENGMKDTESIQRSPDGSVARVVATPTPGAMNVVQTGPETYTALLRGENEVPAVETMARGGATAVLQGTMLTVTGTYAGLSGDYLFAHLHGGAAGENGPVEYTLTSTPVSTTEGNFLAGDNTFTVRETFADSLRAGLIYVNVHSDANPGGELRGQLSQAPQNLPVALSGANEVPPVTTPATGSATVVLNGSTLLLSGSFSDLTADYLFSHIHAGAADVNGPVVVALNATVGDDMRSGEWDAVMNTFELRPTFADSVRAGLAYVNVHSADFPGGEIRGQIGFEGERMVVTIAEARAAGSGATVTVMGTVTRAMGAFTYFQDDTAGLTIRQTGGAFRDAVDNGTIAPGTELTVTGTLSEFNSLLQINGGDLSDFEIGETGDVPDAQTVTLAELAANGEAYEAELVRVEGVTFDADGTFAAGTNYDITDDSGSLVLRVIGANDTEVDGTDIPSQANVTAVVGQFSSSDPAAGYQLQPIQASDVEPIVTDAALVQIVHNAPDPNAAEVDVYVDDVLVLDDLAFQSATAFLELPSETEVEIAVAPGSSTSVDDAVFVNTYELAEGERYQVVAQGVLDPSMFAANPDGISTAFTLAVNAFVGDNPGTPDEGDDVEVNFFHGTPDAPAVDVRTGDVAMSILFNDVPYGDFVFNYQPLLATETELEVTSADGTVSFGTATADLSGLEGQFVTAMASGFADPSANQNGAPLSLLLVLPDGTTVTAVVSTAGEADGGAPEFALFAPAPNPSAASTRITFSLAESGDATVAVYDALGRRVAVLADEALTADRHERQLDTARLAAGVYVVRLSTEGGVQQQTLTVVR